MRRAVRRIDTGAWLQGLLWGAFVYGVHKYGVLAGFYLTYSWFQMITHAASASGLTVILGLVGLELGYRRRRLLVFVVVVTGPVATGWEVIEYLGLLDGYGVYLYFHGLTDAAVDMFSNAVGTAVGLAILRRWTGLEPSRAPRLDADRGGADTGDRSGRWFGNE